MAPKINAMAARDAPFAELPLTRAAIDFAGERHAGQRRDSEDASFVSHPLEVATLLQGAGFPDSVIAAGALHEVLEHTGADSSELESRFGADVAQLVESVSDDPSIEDRQERRAALRLQVAAAGQAAAAVFAADKVSKAGELRLKAARGELGAEEREKLEHYRASLDMLSDALPGHALVARLSRELEALSGV